MTQPQQGCCGGRAASVAAAQRAQGIKPTAAAESFKIAFDDGTKSASTWPDKRSAEIALARSPKKGKVVKA